MTPDPKVTVPNACVHYPLVATSCPCKVNSYLIYTVYMGLCRGPAQGEMI